MPLKYCFGRVLPLAFSKALTDMTGNPRLTSMDEAADVLVVDDDPTVAEVVAGYLDRAGYAVDRAADGPPRRSGRRGTGPTWSSST